MNLIIPMAGRGKRMRPHTLTIPKPLLPIAGKPIVQRLAEDISGVVKEPIEKIGFIIGDFGKEVEKKLKKVAADLGAKGHIFYQEEALGTAHAIMCASEILSGKLIVAFADTLFRADFTLDTDTDGIIWVKQIENPGAFGVVKLDGNNIITDFVEKPDTFVSDLAIIGIYYFKDGEYLKRHLKYLLDNNIKEKGEFQLTNALENMKQEGTKFTTGEVVEWLDCGNKDATVHTNQRVLENTSEKLVADSVEIKNSIIIKPCYIGENVTLNNSIVGPHVSIDNGTSIESSILKNTIVQQHSSITHSIISNSMIGNHAVINGKERNISLGDHSTEI